MVTQIFFIILRLDKNIDSKIACVEADMSKVLKYKWFLHETDWANMFCFVQFYASYFYTGSLLKWAHICDTVPWSNYLFFATHVKNNGQIKGERRKWRKRQFGGCIVGSRGASQLGGIF